jgi:thiamine kinase-like enzyme
VVCQVAQLGGWSPPGLPWLLHETNRAQETLAASGFDRVPCSNDPMSGNLLVDEAKAIMLIDYEYASNNDRCCDLGIWFSKMFFDPAREAELTEAYFGRVTPQAARITVWKHMRARRVMHDPRWPGWLRTL